MEGRIAEALKKRLRRKLSRLSAPLICLVAVASRPKRKGRIDLCARAQKNAFRIARATPAPMMGRADTSSSVQTLCCYFPGQNPSGRQRICGL